MHTIIDHRSASPGRLPRFLAAVLFMFSAFVALPTVLVLVVAVFRRDLAGFAIAVGSGALGWMLAWLGRLLWAGRPIPRWFIAAFLVFTMGGPLVGVLLTGDRDQILSMFAMVSPMALVLWMNRPSPVGKPAKPAPDDDLI